jgi:peptidoglycan hydrolase CwlO-like protein
MFLEAQEAFLRNLTWIVLLYLCASLKDNNIIANEIMSRISCCWILIIFFLILFARYQTQMKVYKAVWDAGKHNNIEKEANDIEKKVNDITENVNRIKKNVDRIKAKVDGIAENVNRIKKRVNRINKRAKF